MGDADRYLQMSATIPDKQSLVDKESTTTPTPSSSPVKKAGKTRKGAITPPAQQKSRVNMPQRRQRSSPEDRERSGDDLDEDRDRSPSRSQYSRATSEYPTATPKRRAERSGKIYVIKKDSDENKCVTYVKDIIVWFVVMAAIGAIVYAVYYYYYEMPGDTSTGLAGSDYDTGESLAPVIEEA